MDKYNPSSYSEEEFLKSIPELKRLQNITENNAWHDNDVVYTHTMAVFKNIQKNIQELKKLKNYFQKKVNNLTKKEILLWSSLLHDIGKPETIIIANGITSSPQHELKGSQNVEIILKRFNFDQNDIDQIVKIVKNHSLPNAILSPKKTSNQIEKDLEEIKIKFPDIFVELMVLGLSDTQGSQLCDLNPNEFKFRVKQYKKILNSFKIST